MNRTATWSEKVEGAEVELGSFPGAAQEAGPWVQARLKLRLQG